MGGFTTVGVVLTALFTVGMGVLVLVEARRSRRPRRRPRHRRARPPGSRGEPPAAWSHLMNVTDPREPS